MDRGAWQAAVHGVAESDMNMHVCSKQMYPVSQVKKSLQKGNVFLEILVYPTSIKYYDLSASKPYSTTFCFQFPYIQNAMIFN